MFWNVILPLSTSALTAMGILVFLNTWNDVFWSLLVTNKTEMRTLSAGPTVLNGVSANLDRGLMLAGATLVTIPVLMVYVIIQRRIIKGIMITGIGGQ